MEKHSTSVNADGKDQKHWALVRENAKNAKIFLKDFTAYVECPKGIANVNEWFASNIFDFYQMINDLVVIVPPCKRDMSIGQNHAIVEAGTSAKDYIQRGLGQVRLVIEDPKAFPTRSHVPFPDNFASELVPWMVKILLMVMLHWVSCEECYGSIVKMSMQAHFHTLLNHLYTFAAHFGLLEHVMEGDEEIKSLFDNLICINK